MLSKYYVHNICSMINHLKIILLKIIQYINIIINIPTIFNSVF